MAYSFLGSLWALHPKAGVHSFFLQLSLFPQLRAAEEGGTISSSSLQDRPLPWVLGKRILPPFSGHC